jgi:hypothetical protein
MGVQFEWQVGDSGQSEMIARTERRRLPRWVWLALHTILIGIVVLAAGGYLTLRLLYERARHRALVQIRDTLQVEMRAFAEGDVALFMAQQDRPSADWYRLQALCAAAGASGPSRQAMPTKYQDLCFPPLSDEVRDLELRGDVAWVEVVEDDGSPVRQVRFYRRTDRGWLHTAPRPDFWGGLVQQRYDKIVVRYHKRDRPYIDPLLEHIVSNADNVASNLLYALPIGRAKVDFVIEYARLLRARDAETLYVQDDRIVLLSPWLSGIPIDRTWDEASLDELTYHVAHGLASTATRSSDYRELGPLQRAIAAEYAAWYTTRDPAQAPLLRRIIERNGEEALPRMFLSIKSASNTTLFMMRWLSVHPNEAAFFETVLNIEREAIEAGLKETFLLFQDERWLADQEAYFDRAQIENPYPSPAPVQVVDVSISDTYASVVIQPTLVPLQGHLPQTDGDTALFRRENWDWKHSSNHLPSLSSNLTVTPMPDESP